MAGLIDKFAAVNMLIDLENEFQQYQPFHGFEHAMYRKVCEVEMAIGKLPAVDAVSRGLFEQIKWERDIAMEQLAEHGIAFGAKSDPAILRPKGEWIKDGDFLVCLNCESEINIKNSLGVENRKNF